MKALFIFFSIFYLFISHGRAQEVVFDAQTAAAVTSNGAVRNSAEFSHNEYLGKINNNIQGINLNVASVVAAQTMIYNGLANVNSALKDGIAVKNMTVTIDDMISYLNQCVELAKAEPYLLLFATGIEQQMQARALVLIKDISGYVLKSGDNVLADYNSRDQLLRKISQQLEIMDSLAYGAWRAMYWAQERGIIASVNPYAAYINHDKAFVSQIIANAKYLQQ